MVGRFMIVLLSLCFVFAPQATSGATDCKGLNDLASRHGTYVPTDDAGRTVTGRGRLQFYSAPDFACKMKGVFVIENQTVDAYAEYNKFTSVVYLGEGKGKPVMGWVTSGRLKPNGLGIAPRQK